LIETNYGNTLKPAATNYNIPIPEDKKKNNVMNLCESGIREELDLEISTVISILKEYHIPKEVCKRREIELYFIVYSIWNVRLPIMMVL
jgi:hypothetical protein